MARRQTRPVAAQESALGPDRTRCGRCDRPAHVAYPSRRTSATRDGRYRLAVAVRRCQNAAGPQSRRADRPEGEGHWALPHGAFGPDVSALSGRWRCAEHRSVPAIHQALVGRGLAIAARSVTHLLPRGEERLARRLTDHTRLAARRRDQGQGILALDGLPPDVGHEVLWVLRDCLAGGAPCPPPPRPHRGRGSPAAARSRDRAPGAAWRGPPRRAGVAPQRRARGVAGRAAPGGPVPLPAGGGQARRRGRSPRQEAPEAGSARRPARRAGGGRARRSRGDGRTGLLSGGPPRADR
jgi:hypothetical protein